MLSVDISGNNIIIPKEMGNLVNLRGLWINPTRIKEKIPIEVSSLQNLIIY